MIAPKLLAHVAEGIQRTGLVKFIDGHQIGEIEHVDFLQLAGRSVLGSHHVQAHRTQFRDGRVRLTDARSFHDNPIKTSLSTNSYRLAKMLADRRVGLPGGQRTHEHVGAVDRVHANPIPKQGTARLALGRIDG